jgi:hypothetical protein
MDKRIYTLLFIAVILAIIYPGIQSMSMFQGEDSQVLYSDGLFGKRIEKVTVDIPNATSAHTYTANYPWWHWSNLASGMNIYGISSPAQSGEGDSSNWLYIDVEYGSDPVPITVKQQNDLYMKDTFEGYWDGERTISTARLRMYEGLVTDTDKEVTGDLYAEAYSHGPYEYGDKFNTSIMFNPNPDAYFVFGSEDYSLAIDGSGVYDYTLQERYYQDHYLETDGWIMDRAWVSANVYEPSEDSVDDGKGSITVRVLDDLVQKEAYVDVYKNGQKHDTVHLEDGSTTLKGLEYADYRFRVDTGRADIPESYEAFAYDSVPYQQGYDLNEGTVELTSNRDQINYVIIGVSEESKENNESGFTTPDNLGYSDVTNTTIIKDTITGGSGGLQGVLDSLTMLFYYIFAFMLFGIPIVLLAFAGIFLFKSGLYSFAYTKIQEVLK